MVGLRQCCPNKPFSCRPKRPLLPAPHPPLPSLQMNRVSLFSKHRPKLVWRCIYALGSPTLPPGTLPHAPGKPPLHPVMLQAAVSSRTARARSRAECPFVTMRS